MNSHGEEELLDRGIISYAQIYTAHVGCFDLAASQWSHVLNEESSIVALEIFLKITYRYNPDRL